MSDAQEITSMETVTDEFGAFHVGFTVELMPEQVIYPPSNTMRHSREYLKIDIDGECRALPSQLVEICVSPSVDLDYAREYATIKAYQEGQEIDMDSRPTVNIPLSGSELLAVDVKGVAHTATNALVSITPVSMLQAVPDLGPTLSVKRYTAIDGQPMLRTMRLDHQIADVPSEKLAQTSIKVTQDGWTATITATEVEALFEGASRSHPGKARIMFVLASNDRLDWLGPVGDSLVMSCEALGWSSIKGSLPYIPSVTFARDRATGTISLPGEATAPMTTTTIKLRPLCQFDTVTVGSGSSTRDS